MCVWEREERERERERGKRRERGERREREKRERRQRERAEECVYVCTWVHVCVHASWRMHMYVCLHIGMYASVRVSVYACVYMYMYVQLYLDILHQVVAFPSRRRSEWSSLLSVLHFDSSPGSLLHTPRCDDDQSWSSSQQTQTLTPSTYSKIPASKF